MAFNRDKYAGSKMSSVKKAQDDAKKSEKSFYRSDGTTTFHNVNDGKNWFRIAPAHNSEDTPYQPCRTTFLKCEVDKYEDGEKTGEKEVKTKKVFIATMHSPKVKGVKILTKDPIEVYISYAYANADELYSGDKDGKAKFLNPITGYRAAGKWVPGIRPSTEFICYAWNEEGELGRLGLNNPWMKKMEEISLEENENDVLGIDIFSNPDEGRPVIIKRSKDEHGKTNYVITADAPAKINGKYEDFSTFFERVKVTDEQLAKLEEMKPLKEMYDGVYSQRDFDLALDGIKRFDDEHKYGIFENDDFLTELQEIGELVPEDPKAEENNVKSGKNIDDAFDKHEKKKAEAVEEITPIRMKKFLREYISSEYGEKFELPNIMGEELNKWYGLALQGEELPFPVKVETKVTPKTVKVETKEEAPELEETDGDLDMGAANDLKAQLAKLRGKK